MTKAEIEHLEQVQSLGCIVCGAPAEIHHPRNLGAGMSQKAPHWLAIPLCLQHHRGDFGTHGKGRREFHNIHGSEVELLARTLERLHKVKQGCAVAPY